MPANLHNTQQTITPTIKANYIGNILQAYKAKGHDTDTLLTSLGLKPLASIGSARISVAQFMDLTNAIQATLEDEMLGYMNSPVPIGSLDLLSSTMIKLPTLGDALAYYSDFLALFNGGHPVLQQKKTSGTFELRLQCHSALQAASPYFMQRMLLTSYKSICWLSKTKIALNRVAFSFPLNEDINELGFVFDCPSIIEAEQCYLSFSEDIFKLPITQNSEDVEDFSENFGLYTLLWPKLNSLDSKIRHIIGPSISQGFPPFADIAAALNISTQTLSRRLHDQASSYQQIKDNIRRDAAIALLTTGKLSIKEVAYEVGFKESSSFSKAFKQWVGVSPSDYLNTV